MSVVSDFRSERPIAFKADPKHWLLGDGVCYDASSPKFHINLDRP
jgi:hypothetical protein